jgi:hypothetical protein
MHRFLYACSALSLLAAACVTSGERSSGGQCPTGEVCSGKTPKGLLFRGPGFADDWFADASVKITAVGGSQQITVVNALDQLSLTYPFSASLDNNDLTADAPTGALLRLHGAHDGSAMLRIKDTDNTLFDRVEVTAATIASADVVAFHDEALLANDPAPAMMLGGDVQLMARLRDAGLHRLVDQSLTIGVTDVATTALSWDTVKVTPPGTGTYAVALNAGGRVVSTGSVTVVDAITAVVPGWTTFDATNPPRANQSLTACLEARNGEQPVVGATWTLTAEGADSSTPFVASNCLSFVRSTPGVVTVHGAAMGHSADLSITVQPAASLTRDDLSAPDLTRGEIAATAEATMD